eukprot:4154041-Prymnesium_polylepis.1
MPAQRNSARPWHSHRADCTGDRPQPLHPSSYRTACTTDILARWCHSQGRSKTPHECRRCTACFPGQRHTRHPRAIAVRTSSGTTDSNADGVLAWLGQARHASLSEKYSPLAQFTVRFTLGESVSLTPAVVRSVSWTRYTPGDSTAADTL